MKSGRQKRELKFSRRFFLTITILFTITFYISSFLLEPGEGKFKRQRWKAIENTRNHSAIATAIHRKS